MSKGRGVFTALTLLACLCTNAEAAQCGSTASGFEAWKGQFAAEARGQGISPATIAALMITTYATATIAADRGCRGFLRRPHVTTAMNQPYVRARGHSSSRVPTSAVTCATTSRQYPQWRQHPPPTVLLAAKLMSSGTLEIMKAIAPQR